MRRIILREVRDLLLCLLYDNQHDSSSTISDPYLERTCCQAIKVFASTSNDNSMYVEGVRATDDLEVPKLLCIEITKKISAIVCGRTLLTPTYRCRLDISIVRLIAELAELDIWIYI